MMESQQEVLAQFVESGVMIGKVQVSNAIIADWLSMAAGRQQEAIAQLSEFAEDRYLHQTGRLKADGTFELSEDLPKEWEGSECRDQCNLERVPEQVSEIGLCVWMHWHGVHLTPAPGLPSPRACPYGHGTCVPD